MVPATVFAQEGGLCEHHTQHDASCGYTEGTAEVPCAHAHTEQCYTSVTQCVHTHTEQCYSDGTLPAEGEEKTADACAHQCSEESGCITKTLSCQHQHDAGCGYAPATAGTPCTYVCEICNSGEAECICETLCTPENIHADCPVCSAEGADLAACKGTAPAVCTCQTLCTAESIDADCPVCSAEGADLAACKGTAVCTCKTLCTGEEINGDCPVCSEPGAELDKVCLGIPTPPDMPLGAGSNTVYVGGVELVGSSDNIVYATTNGNGEVVTAGASADNYNIKWDGSTLTLHDATIQKELYASGFPLSNIAGAAIGVYNQSGDANLTIKLEGTNTIKDVSTAIHVLALSGSASLTITGDGILSASSVSSPGIRVQSNTGNGTLAITGAKVTASSSYSGVQIRCGDSSNASLTVNGGSLTATGSGVTFTGIKMQFGSGGSGTGTPTVTVSGNAIVRANGSAGGIASNSSTEVQFGAGPGIVFDGKNGTVYGDVTLDESLTTGEDETLTIPEGSSLNCNDKLTNNGTIQVNGGTLTGEPGGNIVYAPAITAQPSPQTVKEDETAAFTVTASGSDLTYQWQQSTDSGSTWTNIDGATSKTYTISNAAPDWDGRQYRCVVTNSVGSVTSSAATLTVQENPDYKISISPATMDFDTVTEGYSERNAQMVRIENLGNRPLTLTQPVSTTGNFVVSVLSNTALPVRSAAVFTVRPRTGLPAGTYTEDILFSANPIEPDSGSGISCWVSVTFTVKHDLVKTEYKAPSCTKDGNLEFWTCRVCGKHFLDDQGKYPIKEADTVLQATGHSYRFGRCTVCGAKDPKYKPGTICPQTGDTTPITLYVSVLLTSGAALLALGTRKRRKC